MKLSNKEIIIAAFSKKDRKKLWLPEYLFNIEDITSRTVTSWIHKSGHLGFVVLNVDGALSGIILEPMQMKQTTKVCMCDWCFSVYPNAQMAQFSFRRTRNSVIGFYSCGDLGCEGKILSSDTNNVHNMRETLSKEGRIARYYCNVREFWDRHVLSEL